MAKTSQRCPSAAHAEVQDAGLHPLPPVRPGARRLPQVRRVPDLPARAGAQRLHPRHDEVELVSAMSMTDPIADFLTRMRNAAKAQHHDVTMPSSKLKRELARILKEQGYIEAYEVARRRRRAGRASRSRSRSSTPQARKPVITGLQRVSRPGQRTYVDHAHIPRIQGGMGTAIISTSQGRHDRPRGPQRGRRRRGRGEGLVDRSEPCPASEDNRSPCRPA